jgi:hypothetical protein
VTAYLEQLGGSNHGASISSARVSSIPMTK